MEKIRYWHKSCPQICYDSVRMEVEGDVRTSRKPGSNLKAAMVSQITSPPLPQSQYFFSNMELLANKIKPNITVTVFFINERRHLSTHPPLKKFEKS